MAPPVYKPLTSAGGLTGAPNLPAEIFAPPADVTFDQVLAIQAQQRAQALQEQNAQIQIQNNEIALAEKQRQADEQRQLREAIARSSTPMTQATTETGQDVPDTLGGGTIDDTFDPNQTLDTVKRILAQQGNLEGMLQVEKAQNDRKGYTPLSEAEREYAGQFLGAELPEGVSQSFVKDMGALYGKSLYSQQQQDTRDNRTAAQSFVGYEDIPGAPRLGTARLTKLGERQAGTIATIDNLEAQKELIRENGTFNLTGTAAALQKALSAENFNLNRIRTGSGAGLTGIESELIEAMQSATASGGNVTKAITDYMTDRDPVEVLSGIQSLLQRNFDAEMLSAGKYRRGAQYSPTVLKNLGIDPTKLTNIEDDGNNLRPVDTTFKIPKVNTPGAGGRTQEELSYKEQYKEKLRAQRGM